MKRTGLLIVLSLFCVVAFAQKSTIEWQKIEVAQKKAQAGNKKKFFVDIYTDWCGWCKRMDATSFQDSIVVKIMSKYYHPVKMNAEQAEDVDFKGTIYKNPNPGKSRSTHELAAKLLNGKLSYPSFLVADETFQSIMVLPGYRDAREFEKILWYFCSDDYKRYNYEKYSEIYDKDIRPKMLEQLR